jgi:glycosyltransferase involved in cell wall biosynthesis
MPIRVIFVGYGVFNSNSGGHIANFANGVARSGHVAVVCADGDPESVHDFVDSQFFAFTNETIELDPRSVLTCGGDSIGLERTILHAWTPREKVRLLVEHLRAEGIRNYFVHLEDNEDVVAAANLGVTAAELRRLPPERFPNPYPLTLSHPERYRHFLAGATGVTAIVSTLGEFVPPGVPIHVLEPGVDAERFCGSLPSARADELRAELGIAPDEAICVYHGNMHAANQREIFSLYTAFLILARRGRRVRLIRTGKDFTEGLDLSYADLKTGRVVELGFLDHARLLEILKLADFFIQPGASNAFNDYRFPSKLPEFLALGRPVILPASNIGLRMRDGVDALLLHRGDGVEIADQVGRILDDPNLRAQLGANARRFALAELDWGRNCASLLEFYATAINVRKDGEPSNWRDLRRESANGVS